MVDITKDSKADPVEDLHPEAQGQTNLQGVDISRAAAPPGGPPPTGTNGQHDFIAGGYPLNSSISLTNTVPFIDMNGLLPGGTVDASDIEAAIQTLITNYSRVRLIRYRRLGDNFTYQRFGYVNSPDSSNSELTLAGAGLVFPPLAVVDQSEYLNYVAQARNVMQQNFLTLFAIVPYCHVQCHTDNPPPPPPSCHTNRNFDPGGGGDQDTGVDAGGDPG